MADTLNNVALADVTSEDHRVYSDLDYQSFPLSDSSQAMIFDYNGVKRVVTLSGVVTDTQANLMDNFITPIEALEDGNQLNTVVYHSDFYASGSGQSGNFNVKVDSFKWTKKAGTPTMVDYTITLFEGL